MSGKYLIFSVIAILLNGCSSIVQLMPTPVVLEDSRIDVYKLDKDAVEKEDIWVAYATNKLPSGSEDSRSYSVFFDQNIRLGFAKYKLHEDEAKGEIKRKKTFSLKLDKIEAVTTIDKESSLKTTTTELGTYFNILNQALHESRDKDLTVYVHGANATFYRAAAQAAQYRHFTGQNSVFLVYVWPTSENVFKYGTDVKNAGKSVTIFERLLELLFRKTDARSINIIAYSAGAQIANPALASIAEKARFINADGKQKKVRFSEIYYASPDLDLNEFIDKVPLYMKKARNVTFTINMRDMALGFTSDTHGKSRLGRPDGEELSAQEAKRVIEMSQTPAFTIIDVGASKIPGMSKGSHSYWYDNNWVSSDVLMQLFFHAKPEKRGLAKHTKENGLVAWYFPQDYPQRVMQAGEILLENYQE